MAEPADIANWIPRRPSSAFKGTFGHLAVIAGSAEKTGAAVLAANAALRAGTGLVTLFLPREAWARLGALRPEVMVEDMEGWEAVLAPGSRFSALAVGPGLGLLDHVTDRVRRLWTEAPQPAVFDADGLNALVGAFAPSSHPRLVTPHPGEAGRLLGVSARDVQADRRGALERLAAEAPTLLKGRYTLVSDAIPWVNPTGGVQLATAGSGDVLTGVAGAMLAQGLLPVQAGVVAAWVHGTAAELVGAAPVLAGDVADAIPDALQRVWSGRDPFRRVQ